MRELVFEVREDVDGGYHARSIGEGIFTQGDTWDELKDMVMDATKGYFGEGALPDVLRLHLITERDEILKVALRHRAMCMAAASQTI